MDTTKDRIMVHAATLFAKNGCKAVTMDDIANSMGISKRTIYETFTDKKNLLEACLHYFFKHPEFDMEQLLESADNIVTAIFKLLDNTSKFFLQLKFNFLNEVQKYYPETYDKTVKVYKRLYLENTEKMLQKGKKDGIVRADLSPSILAVLFSEVSTLILNKDVFADYGVEKKVAMHVCMSCITRGMLTEKGVQILDEHIDEFRRTKTPVGRFF
jgi:AcrR family transcriptional regulator